MSDEAKQVGRRYRKAQWTSKVVSEEERIATKQASKNTLSKKTHMGYAYIDENAKLFCEANHVSHLPMSPQTVVDFLSSAAETNGPRSLRTMSYGIRHYHRAAGHPDPTKDQSVMDYLASCQRDKASRPKKAFPFTVQNVKDMCQHFEIADDAESVQNKFLLLVSFNIAARRGEVVRLRFEDVTVFDEGLIVFIEQSKTDQKREGAEIAICKGRHEVSDIVRAFRDWCLMLSRILGRALEPGDPLLPTLTVQGDRDEGKFVINTSQMSTQTFNARLKRFARMIGLDPKKVSGHSARRGFANEANRLGVPRTQIQVFGRWSSDAVNGYFDASAAFKDSPTGKFGL